MLKLTEKGNLVYEVVKYLTQREIGCMASVRNWNEDWKDIFNQLYMTEVDILKSKGLIEEV